MYILFGLASKINNVILSLHSLIHASICSENFNGKQRRKDSNIREKSLENRLSSN